MIGYPAVISAAMVATDRAWPWALIIFQFAASICSTIMVFRLARAFRLNVYLSLAVAAAQATSMQFVVDQAVLSDSLCASAMTIAICILGVIALKREPAALRWFLTVGGLIVVAFLIRNVIEYMAAGLLPLAVAAALVERTRLRRITALALVFVPLVAAHLAYTEWNKARVGAAVITTISAVTLFTALTEAAQSDPALFAGSTPIDEVGRLAVDMMKPQPLKYEAMATDSAINILHLDYGWNIIRVSQEITLAYLRAWRDHPAIMI